MTATTGRAATAALPSLRDASQAAETAYRDAVYIAHLEGASFAELSHTLGVTRQAVRQMTVRAGVAEKQMRERLAEIDAWYERAIEKMMDRDHAETVALKALEDHADDPRVQRIVAQLDEAAALRKRLEAFDDARMDF